MDMCVLICVWGVCVCVSVREREKRKKVLHSKQSFCPLTMLLNFSVRIFELSTVY